MKVKLFAAAVLSMVFVFGTAVRSADEEKDIVDTAVADGRFTTLAAALQAAGLVETLKGEGPFTVFAPTDDAFAKLPAGTLDSLPHNGAVVTLLAVCGVTHRDSYKDIFVVAIVGALFALTAVIVLGSIFGTF